MVERIEANQMTVSEVTIVESLVQELGVPADKAGSIIQAWGKVLDEENMIDYLKLKIARQKEQAMCPKDLEEMR